MIISSSRSFFLFCIGGVILSQCLLTVAAIETNISQTAETPLSEVRSLEHIPFPYDRFVQKSFYTFMKNPYEKLIHIEQKVKEMYEFFLAYIHHPFHYTCFMAIGEEFQKKIAEPLRENELALFETVTDKEASGTLVPQAHQLFLRSCHFFALVKKNALTFENVLTKAYKIFCILETKYQEKRALHSTLPPFKKTFNPSLNKDFDPKQPLAFPHNKRIFVTPEPRHYFSLSQIQEFARIYTDTYTHTQSREKALYALNSALAPVFNPTFLLSWETLFPSLTTHSNASKYFEALSKEHKKTYHKLRTLYIKKAQTKARLLLFMTDDLHEMLIKSATEKITTTHPLVGQFSMVRYTTHILTFLTTAYTTDLLTLLYNHYLEEGAKALHTTDWEKYKCSLFHETVLGFYHHHAGTINRLFWSLTLDLFSYEPPQSADLASLEGTDQKMSSHKKIKRKKAHKEKKKRR